MPVDLVRLGEGAGVLSELIDAEQLRPERLLSSPFRVVAAGGAEQSAADQIHGGPIECQSCLLRPAGCQPSHLIP